MANESVAIDALRAADRRHELYLKASSILRVIRAAAYNEADPAAPDAIAQAAWAVEGMLDEMHALEKGAQAAAAADLPEIQS